MTCGKSIELNDELVRASLLKLEEPLCRYLRLQRDHKALSEPETDPEFRRAFCGFYRVRRNDKWRNQYFDLMKSLRNQEFDFARCLEILYERTGRIEASFASKLIATHDPDRVVIDSIVLGHLDLRLRAYGDSKARMDVAVEVYAKLTCAFARCIRSPSGLNAIAAFRSAYPSAEVTDVKIVDLILWQSRGVG